MYSQIPVPPRNISLGPRLYRVRLALHHHQGPILRLRDPREPRPHICSNGRLVAWEKLERIVLDAIFEEVFSPETLAYLSAKVNEALASAAMPADGLRKKQRAELAQARKELENIQAAIGRAS